MTLGKTVFDLDCENFNLYFANRLKTITPQAKESIPKDVLFKMFLKGGDVNAKGSSKLSFLAKLYVLWKSLRSNIFIVIEGDDKNGLTVEEFVNLKQAVKVRDYNIDRSNEYLLPTATFVTGSKELVQTLAYLNNLSTSPAYKHLLRTKNPVPNKSQQNRDATNYVCRFLSHYEANRKKIGMESGLSISDWLILIHIYHGKEVESNTLWKDIYKYSYNSSKTKIKVAFGTLQSRGYIVKHGASRGTKIQITPFGVTAVNDILQKYAVNC